MIFGDFYLRPGDKITILYPGESVIPCPTPRWLNRRQQARHYVKWIWSCAGRLISIEPLMDWQRLAFAWPDAPTPPRHVYTVTSVDYGSTTVTVDTPLYGARNILTRGENHGRI